MDASIFDSALSHNRRSDALEKNEKKIACSLLVTFACGQVSSPRLYRLTVVFLVRIKKTLFLGWIGSLTGMNDQKMGISEIGASYADKTFGQESRSGKLKKILKTFYLKLF